MELALSSNGLAVLTAAGASVVVIADPVPTANVVDLLIKAAIPLGAAIVIKVASAWIEVRKARALAQIKREGEK